MAFDSLIEKIIKTNNRTVMGLDPQLDFVPEWIKKAAVSYYGNTLEAAGEAIFEFCKGLIDSSGDLLAAVKPQSAFFELYGLPGMSALDRTIRYAKEAGLYVILDAKRGDIGTTAAAYASGLLGKTKLAENSELIEATGADCLTVNPYFGIDGIKPFIDVAKEYDKSIFILVKTSNPSSAQFQDIKTVSDVHTESLNASGKVTDGDDRYTIGSAQTTLNAPHGLPLYLNVADRVSEWGADTVTESGYGCVGAVAGATYPKQLAELRQRMPRTFLLIPGYGAQGGTAKDAALAFDAKGLGGIVNSSRGLMCAYQKAGDDGENYKKFTREAVIEMRDDINSAM